MKIYCHNGVCTTDPMFLAKIETRRYRKTAINFVAFTAVVAGIGYIVNMPILGLFVFGLMH